MGTVQQENAAIGLFITLEEPTAPMNAKVLRAGHYHSPGLNRDFPRIQVLTIADLLKGDEPKMPPQFGTFKQAQRVYQTPEAQGMLDLE